MRKLLLFLISIMLLLVVTGCNSESVTHVGVNVEILEISKEIKGMVVKSLDENSILGEKCYINCEGEGTYYIFVNNDTQEVFNINFDDFLVGDMITVDVKSVENKYALTSRLQLLTQR